MNNKLYDFLEAFINEDENAPMLFNSILTEKTSKLVSESWGSDDDSDVDPDYHSSPEFNTEIEQQYQLDFEFDGSTIKATINCMQDVALEEDRYSDEHSPPDSQIHSYGPIFNPSITTKGASITGKHANLDGIDSFEFIGDSKLYLDDITDDMVIGLSNRTVSLFDESDRFEGDARDIAKIYRAMIEKLKEYQDQ